MAQQLRFGTTGWSFKDWSGNFYPAGTAQRDYLGHYAQQLDVVEVDSTFYAIPRRQLCERWFDVTPADFRFSLKTPRAITHEKRLADCNDTMDAFLEALAPLGDKLLAVLLQFGYFNRQAFSSAKAFLERLDAFLERYAAQVPLVCEIRNKQWLGPAYFDLLRRHNVSAALIEQSWLPPLSSVVAQYDVLTGPLAYVRLLGDRQGIEEITTTWDRVVVDRSADLRQLADTLKSLAATLPVFVLVNNHYAGHAPSTIEQLREFVA